MTTRKKEIVVIFYGSLILLCIVTEKSLSLGSTSLMIPSLEFDKSLTIHLRQY